MKKRLLLLVLLLPLLSPATVSKTELGASVSTHLATNVTAYLSDWTYLTAREVTCHESGFSLGWLLSADMGLSLSETLTSARRAKKAGSAARGPWVPSNTQTLSVWWRPLRTEEGRLLIGSGLQWKEVRTQDYGMYKGNVRWTFSPVADFCPISPYADFEFRVTGSPAYSGWDRLCQLRPKIGFTVPLADMLYAGFYYRAQFSRRTDGDWLRYNVCGIHAGVRF